MPRYKNKLCILFFIFIFCFTNILITATSYAEEVDDFTPVNRIPKNAAPVLNKATSALLDELIILLNKSSITSCEDSNKYLLAIKKLDQNFTAIGNGLRSGQDIRNFYELIKKDPKHQADYLKNLQTIESTWLAEFSPENREWFSKLFSTIDYFGIRQIEATIYNGFNFPTCCTNRININGTFVGLDKIDHFFGNGGLLFEQFQKNSNNLGWNDNLDAIAKINAREEHSLWGLNGLSPKSYGDLAANWQGLHFYQDLFDSKNPYILCNKGSFERNSRKEFQIENYLDESWNESYNCSSVNTQKDLDLFNSNLKKLGIHCPVDELVCENLVNKHKNDPLFIKYSLSPLCSKQFKNFVAVETKEKVTLEDVEIAFRGFTGKIIADLLEKKITHSIFSIYPKLLKNSTIKTLRYEKEAEQAAQVFESMKACMQEEKKDDSINCLRQFTEPGIDNIKLLKFYNTNKIHSDFSPADNCDSESQKLENLVHPNPIGDINLCFKTKKQNSISIGQVYFRKYDDKYKVILMRF